MKTLKYFNLKALSSLNRILNNKESIMKAHTEATTTKDRKTLKKGHYSNLDQEVNTWTEVMRAKDIELSADDIIEKANSLKSNVSENSKKLSTDWFRVLKVGFVLKKINFTEKPVVLT